MCVRMCMCVSVFVFLCVSVCVHVYACMCTCICLNVRVCMRLRVFVCVYIPFTAYVFPLTVCLCIPASVRACPRVHGLFLGFHLLESVLRSPASKALLKPRPIMTLWSWRSFEEITELSKWICCFTFWRASQSSFKILLVNIYLHKKHHYLERKTLGGM